ncbi:hypothetical protein ABZV58_25400 [Nocardia sp. NPDC004654]|uniref:hypothetical protein n=1 Tax=Nocardia sp. NPDC004654 TaxID=3154776 RepID=UPI0033ADC50F
MPADDGSLLRVGVTGRGPDVVVLSGGPGCVHYLEDDALAPRDQVWVDVVTRVCRAQVQEFAV